MNIPQQVSDLNGSAPVQLALQTLARFNFKVSIQIIFNVKPMLTSNLLWSYYIVQGHDLLEFARDSVVLYLDDEDKATRKDAALCCCKLVANSFSGVSFTQFGASRSNRTGGKRRRLIEEVWLQKIGCFMLFLNVTKCVSFLVIVECSCLLYLFVSHMLDFCSLWRSFSLQPLLMLMLPFAILSFPHYMATEVLMIF